MIGHGWKLLTAASGQNHTVSRRRCVSVPTPRSCAEGIRQGVGEFDLIKVNQIGTLTENLCG